MLVTAAPDEWSLKLVRHIEEAACVGTVFLLAARKRRNRQLRALVAALKARGNAVAVHRVDDDVEELRLPACTPQLAELAQAAELGSPLPRTMRLSRRA